MHGNVPFGVASAREIAARTCHESFVEQGGGNILPPDDWFMRITHAIWTDKPSAWLRFFTKNVFPDRTCRSAAAGDTQPSGPLLYVVIRSDAGEDVVDKIMEGADAEWWRKLQRAKRIAAAVDKEL